MISDLDNTIKQLLIKKGQVNPVEVDISFERPGREWSSSVSKPTVNLYLYDIHENHDLRNNAWEVEHSNGIATIKKPPVRIDLSYLITVWTDEMADQHRLLGHLLATLFRYPELPDELLQGSLKGVKWPLRTLIAQPDGIVGNSAELWSALDNQIKPSINYVVTMPIDLDIAFSAPEVKTKVVKFRDGDGKAEELIVQIDGVVHRRGKPDQVVPDATILVKELQMTTTTDEKGRYRFGKLGQGLYIFEVSAPGTKERKISVSVPSVSYDLEL